MVKLPYEAKNSGKDKNIEDVANFLRQQKTFLEMKSIWFKS